MKSIFIASLTAVLCVFVISFMVSALETIGTTYTDLGISFLFACVAGLVALIVMLLWAWPVHFVLRRLQRQSLHWYMLMALVPSLLFIYGLKPFGKDAAVDLLKQALFCSFCAVIAAAVFWYLAVYRPALSTKTSKE